MRKTMETRSHVAAIDDPFERLPEHILHHILALLGSNHVAARTAVVSRTWHRAWSSYPIFDFHFSNFRPRGPVSPDELQTINDRFLDFVDKAMSRLREHGVAIPRLRISATLIKINHSRALLDKWIGMAVDSGTQELYLFFNELDTVDSYSVPARVFSSGSIKTMSLAGRGLITPLDRINTVNMSSLRSLNCYRTLLDAPMLQKLLRGCPLLEELALIDCELLTRIVISGHINLRIVALTGDMSRIEIEALNLEEIDCCNSGAGTLLTQVVLDHCPRVKHLKLKNSSITQHCFQELLSKFPLLESLSIGCCERFQKIMILNPLLKKVEIEECEGLVDIELGSANLSCFRYGTMEMRLPFIRMPNPTAVSSCEANFECDSVSMLGLNWFIQLREFLTRSCQFRCLSFDFNLFYQEEENVLDIGDSLPLLPYDVERLHLSVRMPRSGHAAIMNMMLSLFHPTILRVTPYQHGCEFLKFVCEKLENRGDDDDECSCRSGHRKCWLHELKGVEISCDNRGPLDWRSLHQLLPDLCLFNDVYFGLHWK